VLAQRKFVGKCLAGINRFLGKARHGDPIRGHGMTIRCFGSQPKFCAQQRGFLPMYRLGRKGLKAASTA
jgi:hypothetical protein